MQEGEEFYEEEAVSGIDNVEDDVYNESGAGVALDDDGISPEEEGFMQGYNDETEKDKKRN
jgi:hypothetical protein